MVVRQKDKRRIKGNLIISVCKKRPEFFNFTSQTTGTVHRGFIYAHALAN